MRDRLKNCLPNVVWLVIILTNISALILCFNKVFTYDESYTIALASKSIKEIVDITSQDVHTPFYYVLINVICRLFHLPIMFVSKFLSLVFYDLFLYVGGRFVNEIYGKKVCYFWLLFSAMMPPMIIQTSTARMYTMGLFFVTASIGLAYKCYSEGKTKHWILFTLSSLCGVYVHTFSMIALFFVYGFFLFVILLRKQYKKLIPYGLSGLVVVLAYIPWLVVLYHQMARWSGYEEGWSNTISSVSVEQFKLWVYEWFSALERPQTMATIYGICVMLITGIYAFRYAIKQKDTKPVLGFGLCVLIVCIAIGIGILLVPCFFGRYIFFLFGWLYLMLAIGIEQCSIKSLRVLICIGLLVVGACAMVDEHIVDDETGIEQYEQFMDKFLEEDDIIMCDSYFCFALSIYYPNNEYMIYGGKPSSLPYDCEAFFAWEQLEGVDEFWYLQMEGIRTGDLSAQFEEWDCLRFEHSHYTFYLKQMVRKTE